MNSGDLLVERPEGLYCPPGDFYIDPWRPVARAVITHAHANHARVGHGHYLAAAPGEGVLRAARRDLATDADLWQAHRPLRRAPVAAPGRPRARLGPGAARACGPRVGGLGRLLCLGCGRRQHDLRTVRAAALWLLHHRIHLRPADLPLAAAARAGRTHRPGPQARGATHDGLHRCQARTGRRALHSPAGAARTRRRTRSRRALSVLSGAPDRRQARQLRGAVRRPRRMAGRMEVRRHPRPTRQARRAGMALVTRRRANDRTLPRGRTHGARPPRRHRARR